ncbi:MAG TPA: hypothetical protein VMW69_02910 [Spirochaetia bacterium]|nr:hypothetical protein [Spirochaetia bacterium]
MTGSHTLTPTHRGASADRLALVAFASAAMFGFGPVSVGYFASVNDLSTLSASIRVTSLYFLAVYAVVAIAAPLLRIGSFSLMSLWRPLRARGRWFLLTAAASNAISGWCFFYMLGKIDPLSAAVIMALATVFNFFAARLLLGEDIRLTSHAGRVKWISFLLIVAGVLVTSVYSYLVSRNGTPASATTYIIALASSLFAALRTVTVKGAMSCYQSEKRQTAAKGASGDHPKLASRELALDLPLAVTRFTYLFAFLFTVIAAVPTVAIDRSAHFTLASFFLPSTFTPVLGLIYGGAYALNYIAMSRIEASRMALITRSSIVFTALYMFIAATLFHYGSAPSLLQLPAAFLVILGAYLATRPAPRR